jgi:membrane protein YdbS with pleckstrin-like domain
MKFKATILNIILNFMFGIGLALILVGVALFFILYYLKISFYYSFISSVAMVVFGSFFILLVESIISKYRILDKLKDMENYLKQ